MKLYNFVNRARHEEAVKDAMETHSAEWVKQKDRGDHSIAANARNVRRR